MALKDYTELFQTRGEKYDFAMQQYPYVRDHEFQQAVELASFTSANTILDVPAGGGYLHRFLPADSCYHAHEPCSTFAHASTDTASDLLPLPYQDKSIDISFSIAGVHHIENKLSVFKDIARVTIPHGQFILADVYKGSAVAHFLDDFVGQNNSTGHSGIYIDDATIDELQTCGWRVNSAERKPVDWSFSDKNAMAQFCMSLFDLRNISQSDVISAIDDILGTKQHSDKVSINWELYYLDIKKAED